MNSKLILTGTIVALFLASPVIAADGMGQGNDEAMEQAMDHHDEAMEHHDEAMEHHDEMMESAEEEAMEHHGEAMEHHDEAMEHHDEMMEDMGAEEAEGMAEAELPNAGNKICPVSGKEIGADGTPGVKVAHNGKTYNLCCKFCVKDFKKDPDKYIFKVQEEMMKSEN